MITNPQVGQSFFLFSNPACAIRTSHPTEILSVDSETPDGWMVTGAREMKGRNGKNEPLRTVFFLPKDPPVKFDQVKGWVK